MKSRLSLATLAAAAALFAMPTASQAGFLRDGDDCFGWVRTHADEMVSRVDSALRRMDDLCATMFRRDEAVAVQAHHARKHKKGKKMAAKQPKK